MVKSRAIVLYVEINVIQINQWRKKVSTIITAINIHLIYSPSTRIHRKFLRTVLSILKFTYKLENRCIGLTA